jgi:hypothetical protein
MGLGTSSDVVIIDIDLPRMGGRQVAEHLRRTLGEAVTLIAYTACDQGKSDRRGAGTTFNDWVTKRGISALGLWAHLFSVPGSVVLICSERSNSETADSAGDDASAPKAPCGVIGPRRRPLRVAAADW